MSLLINITALGTRDKREEGKIVVALFRNKVHGGKTCLTCYKAHGDVTFHKDFGARNLTVYIC